MLLGFRAFFGNGAFVLLFSSACYQPFRQPPAIMMLWQIPAFHCSVLH